MYAQNHLAQGLRAGSAGREDAVFIDAPHSGLSLTYRDFFANAKRMAAALVRAGVRPGDRVAVQVPKTVEMLELYVGCVLAGAVLLPLNPAYTDDEMAYFLADAEPALLVCDPARQAGLAPIARRHGARAVLTVDATGAGSLRDARDAQTPGFEPLPRGPEDLAAILYTSGTTGRSKGAMLSHRALRSNSETLRDVWRFTETDVLIHALPIFHTHGLFVATNVAMMAGAQMIFLPRFDAAEVVAHMPRATALMGVPTFYVRLLEEPGLAEAARSMRLFISGSAPLLPETHRRFEKLTGLAILERYGMTETNMNTSNPHDGERRPGTVGFPLPGVELRITRPGSDEALPPGEAGMIEVRGPNLFSGYWRMPEKTAEEMRADGWFITGDLGRIGADGYVEIVGRAKDLVISGGFNIYPREIEEIIDALPGVAESAVIGVPHPDLGEAVVAVVVPEADAQLDTDALAAAIAPRLARFKQPRAWVIAPELPRNTMGKVQKAELRRTHSGLFAR
ncbi:MAG: malonyl-CoA synthase [Alphaproteobacteria bacterium]|nr:MAG: malonyl-CoA synthase [Alphaproteobacteria bacterium]